MAEITFIGLLCGSLYLCIYGRDHIYRSIVWEFVSVPEIKLSCGSLYLLYHRKCVGLSKSCDLW